MDANSTEFPLAWITTGCHAICSLLNFFVQPDTNGGSTLSITLFALELAADVSPDARRAVAAAGATARRGLAQPLPGSDSAARLPTQLTRASG